MYVEQRGGQYCCSTNVRWFMDEITMGLKQRCHTSVYVTIQLHNIISYIISQGLSNISCLTLRLAICFSSSLFCWACRRITSASCSLSSFSYWSGDTLSGIVTMADVKRSFIILNIQMKFFAYFTSSSNVLLYNTIQLGTHWFHRSVWPGCARLERARLWHGLWAGRWDVSAARHGPRLSRSPPDWALHGALLRASALSQQTGEGLQILIKKVWNKFKEVCHIYSHSPECLANISP